MDPPLKEQILVPLLLEPFSLNFVGIYLFLFSINLIENKNIFLSSLQNRLPLSHTCVSAAQRFVVALAAGWLAGSADGSWPAACYSSRRSLCQFRFRYLPLSHHRLLCPLSSSFASASRSISFVAAAFVVRTLPCCTLPFFLYNSMGFAKWSKCCCYFKMTFAFSSVAKFSYACKTLW